MAGTLDRIRRRLRQLGLACLAALALAGPLRAEPATLLADRVAVLPGGRLEASGNVEVLYQGARLQASRIVYDGPSGGLTIEGPLTLVQGADQVILADQAALDADLRNGILQGARLVLDQQMQLAAAEIHRVDGRYTQLYRTVASSCTICAANPVPLWQIRAERVVHDQQAQLLYFTGATFMVGNFPVIYLPRLRMPDPFNTRQTGFLVPRITNSSRLGPLVRIPYFVTLGDSADLTFTPMLSHRTRTLGLRYRQAFATGEIAFDLGVTEDDLRRSGIRAYLIGEGRFDLPRDFELTFGLQAVSDRAYLLDYGFSEADGLVNTLAVARTRDLEDVSLTFTGLRPLRGAETAIADQLPNLQARLHYGRRFYSGQAAGGGEGLWTLGIEAHRRPSQADVSGRDLARFDGSIAWSDQAIFGAGMIGRYDLSLSGALYAIAQDQRYPGSFGTITPAVAAEWRWPLARRGAGGAGLLFEPVAQLAYSEGFGQEPPNEDSGLAEFDEGNLLSLSRFPGEDRQETGLRATAGAHWQRLDPRGWSLDLTAGQVYRAADDGQFTRASGLDGIRSDLLLAGRLGFGDKLGLSARALIGPDLAVTKAESRLDWNGDRLGLAASYAWLSADPAEYRVRDISQLTLDGSYAISRNWTGAFDLRHDYVAGRTTRAGLGLGYVSDCVSVDLSLSRRFTSSANARANTEFGLQVSLLGFGAGGARPRARTCGL